MNIKGYLTKWLLLLFIVVACSSAHTDSKQELSQKETEKLKHIGVDYSTLKEVEILLARNKGEYWNKRFIAVILSETCIINYASSRIVLNLHEKDQSNFIVFKDDEYVLKLRFNDKYSLPKENNIVEGHLVFTDLLQSIALDSMSFYGEIHN
jgi:hypothetical protein